MPSINKKIEIIIAGVGREIDVEIDYFIRPGIRGVQDGGVAVSPDEPAQVEIERIIWPDEKIHKNMYYLFTDEQISALEDEILEGL